MPSWAIILIVILAVGVGFFIGFIFEKRQKNKEKNIGTLMVVNSDTDKEPPYIYLELSRNVDDICSKKSVSLDVKHISHK